jgi:hypothetical protein
MDGLEAMRSLNLLRNTSFVYPYQYQMLGVEPNRTYSI